MSRHPSPSVVPTPISPIADPTPSTPETTRDALADSFLPEVADVSNVIAVSVYCLLTAFQSPAHVPAPGAASSPEPRRIGTPSRKENATDVRSHAASQRPDPPLAMSAEAPPHGGPARQYLNSKITPVLLVGLKMLAKEQ